MGPTSLCSCCCTQSTTPGQEQVWTTSPALAAVLTTNKLSAAVQVGTLGLCQAKQLRGTMHLCSGNKMPDWPSERAAEAAAHVHKVSQQGPPRLLVGQSQPCSDRVVRLLSLLLALLLPPAGGRGRLQL